jgi:ribosomal 30S subunit maturation factor RimM
MTLSWSALGAQVGDKVYDKRAKKVGVVVKKGQSGNYDTIYVNFGGKSPRRIIPMDDAQIRQNYFKVVEE